MGEEGWNVIRGRVQIFLFRMINLGTEKNMVHVRYGVCFRMERTVRRDNGDEFCLGAGKQL